VKRSAIRVLFWLTLLPAIGAIGQVQPQTKLSGTFRPSAAP
jgi:hypothetical protein